MQLIKPHHAYFMTIPVMDLSLVLFSGEVSQMLVANQLYGHGVPHKQYLACPELSVEYRFVCLNGKLEFFNQQLSYERI